MSALIPVMSLVYTSMAGCNVVGQLLTCNVVLMSAIDFSVTGISSYRCFRHIAVIAEKRNWCIDSAILLHRRSALGMGIMEGLVYLTCCSEM